MKMLFFSSDSSEVQHVRDEFTQAGIRCEVRTQKRANSKPRDTELWIHNDRDCHRAFMLCVQLGIGFARRNPEKLDIESSADTLTR